MIKLLFPLFFIFLSFESISQCELNEYYIFGEVRCISDCGTPDFAVIVKNQNGVTIGEEIPVDNYNHPYDFAGCIKMDDEDYITIDVIFNNPSDFAMTPNTNPRYFGTFKSIRVKRISDIYLEAFNKAKDHFDKKEYELAIGIIETLKNNQYKITDGQDYRLSKLLANCYVKTEDYTSASEVIEIFINSDPNIRNGQKFETLSFWSFIRANQKNYKKQKEALDQIS